MNDVVEMFISVLQGIKVLQEVLQCVPSLWIRWKRRLMGDTARSTEKLNSGTHTITRSRSLGPEW